MISHETEIKMAKLHVEIGKGNKGLHLTYFNFDFLELFPKTKFITYQSQKTHTITRDSAVNEGLDGVNRQQSNGQKINRQPSKTEYFYCQPSNERAKISRQISQVSLNDLDRLTNWGHQLVEQAINTSSGNGGDVITLIIHIVVIVEDQ